MLFDVDGEDAEAADVWSAALFDLGAQGVEERDATTLIKGTAGKITLVASFETEAEAEEARATLEAERPEGLPRIEVVIGDAWRDAWKEHFRPFALADKLIVRPPWEPYEAKPGETVLELEPGRAFGTGLHETTSLVATALVAHASELAGQDVLDVGCGSGILSLAALALGARTARAVDVDSEAIDVTRENAVRNGLEARITSDTTDVGDITDELPRRRRQHRGAGAHPADRGHRRAREAGRAPGAERDPRAAEGRRRAGLRRSLHAGGCARARRVDRAGAAQGCLQRASRERSGCRCPRSPPESAPSTRPRGTTRFASCA